jgi:Kef-type K+ transport system membrane component KefB
MTPATHTSLDAFTGLLVQMTAIVASSALLGRLLRPLGQPRVIAEIAAGILLGPSLLGWLAPDMLHALFPAQSLGLLHALSQVGLVCFMFIVGLHVDFGGLRGWSHAAVAISHSSIAAPFALGAAFAVFFYDSLASPDQTRWVFVLFFGVAMSITAFPVLARILTERHLLHTTVGRLAIASAAVDDVTAWCLLAFVVAAARAQGFQRGLRTTALALLYAAAMIWIARPIIRQAVERLSRRSTGLTLTPERIAAIIVLLLLSSCTSELIGVHALFGAFLFGAIFPRKDGLAQNLGTSLEPLVLYLLLPLFFAYSGVRTQLNLLDSPSAWLLCALIIAVASLGKAGASSLAARLTGVPWREAGAIGALMNTRGLMELIVLNIGLDLGVIGPTVFTMMVLMALITTVATTPLLTRLLPEAAQTQPEIEGRPGLAAVGS